MFCLKCGNEIKEDSAFCDKCGKRVKKTHTGKPFKMILTVVISAMVIGLCFFGAFGGKNVTHNSNSAEIVQEEYVDEEQTRISELRENYFNVRFSNGGHVYGAIYANAEFLLRGSKAFEGTEVVAEGTVNSILPAETSEQFLITVNQADYYNDGMVTKVALTGEYPQDGTRFVEGDRVWFVGQYGGISMFERTDGSHAEYAVIKNCKPVEVKTYSFDEINEITHSIFKEDFDIRIESDEVESFYTFNRKTQAGTTDEKWIFNDLGGTPRVSFDGGQSYYSIEFDDDYSHYILKKDSFEGAKDKIKYMSIDGSAIWEKEFEYGSRYVLHTDKVYVYAQGEIVVFDKDSGERMAEPVFVADIDTMRVVGDKVLLENQNSIIAVNSDGKILWRYVSKNGFSIEYNHSTAGGNFVFAEGKVEKDYKGQNQYIKAFRRIDLETGKLVAEIELKGV